MIGAEKSLPGHAVVFVIGHEDVGQKAIAENVLGDVLAVAFASRAGKRAKNVAGEISLGSGLAEPWRGSRIWGGVLGGRRRVGGGCRATGGDDLSTARFLDGGDSPGEVEGKRREFGVILGRDDLSVIPACVKEQAAARRIPLVA